MYIRRPAKTHKGKTYNNYLLVQSLRHLLVAIEKDLLDRDIHTSWSTLRQQLSTHQVITVVLPTTNGEVLKIRRATIPEPIHQRSTPRSRSRWR